MATFFTSKNIKFFNCENCDFICSKLGDYKRHILSGKHLKSTISTKKTSEHKCDNCNKTYKERTGLWKHKKKCLENKNDIIDETNPSMKYMIDIIDTLVQQNKENNEDREKERLLLNTLLNQNKMLQDQIMNNYTTNNTINNNTQTNNFNLNLFLNEQCKNAMNITDFLNTVQVEVEDVANVGKLGYVEGISRIFMKALNSLDVCERPIHCSDLKREVLYVKDNGVWEKEGEDKNSLKKAVQVISHRNIMKIKAWTDANPSWKTHYSKEEDEYLKISYESMGGSTKEEDEKYFSQIIRKVASNVTIDKKKNTKIL